MITQRPDAKLSPRAAIACMLGCSVLWSTASAVIKLMSWSTFAIAGVRGVIAGAALILYLHAVGRRLVLSRATLLASAVVCIKYITFIAANKLTSSASVVALMYTSPVFVLAMDALFFKQKVRGRDTLVSLATVGGVALLALDGAGASGTAGNLLALLCGLTTAVMYVTTARFTRYEETISVVALGNLMSAAVMMPFAFSERLTLTAVNIAGILLLALLQQAGAYILYSFAIRSASALTCSVISCANPLLAPVWSAVLVGEIPGPMAFAGFFVVLGSVTLWSMANAREAHRRNG